MVKKKLGDIEIDLAQADKLIEFGVVLLVAFIVANGNRDSLILNGFPPTTAVPIQWLAFFALILIYYGLIRVRLNISRSI